MDKNQLAAQMIAASLPRDRKFDAMKDENYWHKDLIKFLQQKISTLERKCGTLEEQCHQTEGDETAKHSRGRGRNRRPDHRERNKNRNQKLLATFIVVFGTLNSLHYSMLSLF